MFGLFGAGVVCEVVQVAEFGFGQGRVGLVGSVFAHGGPAFGEQVDASGDVSLFTAPAEDDGGCVMGMAGSDRSDGVVMWRMAGSASRRWLGLGLPCRGCR